jgi:hypothetical protein
MNRLRLPVRVPNEGARRLAWWLCEQPRDAMKRLAGTLPVEPTTVERWISGGIEPGAEVSYAISLFTQHAVVTSDWRSPPEGGWFDRPAPRTYRKAA